MRYEQKKGMNCATSWLRILSCSDINQPSDDDDDANEYDNDDDDDDDEAQVEAWVGCSGSRCEDL